MSAAYDGCCGYGQERRRRGCRLPTKSRPFRRVPPSPPLPSLFLIISLCSSAIYTLPSGGFTEGSARFSSQNRLHSSPALRSYTPFRHHATTLMSVRCCIPVQLSFRPRLRFARTFRMISPLPRATTYPIGLSSTTHFLAASRARQPWRLWRSGSHPLPPHHPTSYIALRLLQRPTILPPTNHPPPQTHRLLPSFSPTTQPTASRATHPSPHLTTSHLISHGAPRASRPLHPRLISAVTSLPPPPPSFPLSPPHSDLSPPPRTRATAGRPKPPQRPPVLRFSPSVSPMLARQPKSLMRSCVKRFSAIS